VSEQEPLYIWAITFDDEVFGLFRTEDAAKADLERQIQEGGPAWEACKVEKRQVS
jgi:hypothetical protein